MKFQTEITRAAVDKAFINHVQRRHFFSDEQHAPAAHDVVDDDIRYRLRLACAGRSVQHERAVQTCFYRLILRAVRAYRQQHSVRAEVRLVRVCGVGRSFVFQPGVHRVRNHRTDKRRLLELVDIIAHVVPHEIIRERQNVQINVVDNFPSGFIGDFFFDARDDCEYTFRVGQFDRRKPAHIEAEFLIQKFQKSIVYLRPVNVKSNRKYGQRYALFVNRHRIKNKRRVFEFFVFRLSPLQKAARHVQTCGAGLFFDGFFLAIKIEQRFVLLFFRKHGRKSFVFVFVQKVFRQRFQRRGVVERRIQPCVAVGHVFGVRRERIRFIVCDVFDKSFD